MSEFSLQQRASYWSIREKVRSGGRETNSSLLDNVKIFKVSCCWMFTYEESSRKAGSFRRDIG